MPEGGDLRQYRSGRDWGSRGDAERAMYDLCRDSKMSHEQASIHAADGAARLAREMGDGKEPELAIRLSRGGPPELQRETGRSMFRTPYFGPYAGQRCKVLEDGTLVPV